MSHDTFEIAVGDTSPDIEHQLQYKDTSDNWNNRDISGYNDVTFRMYDSNGDQAIEDTISGNVSVTDAQNGKVKYSWADGDTDTADEYEVFYTVELSDGSLESFPNTEEGFPVSINERP